MAIATGQLILAMVLAFILLAIIIICANLIHWYGRQQATGKAASQKAHPNNLIVPPDQFILLRVLLDENGHASLSMFQFLMWTLLISFLYIALWFLQVLNGSTTAPPPIDSSLMTLMGISVAVPIASKGIADYKKLKPRSDGESYAEPDYASMLEENGQPSLLRVQMFLWTLAALAIFFGQFLASAFASGASAGSFGLPAVDPTLLFLIGVSQTGYLGSKAYSGTVSKNTQQATASVTPSKTTVANGVPASQPLAIREIIPRSAQVKDQVMLLGTGFGTTADTLMLGQGQVPAADIKRWEDTRIDFVIPDGIQAGTVPIRIVAGGNTVGEQIIITAPAWAQKIKDIDATILGKIWIDDMYNKGDQVPQPLGYFLPGTKYFFFYEFDVPAGTPQWGLTQFKTSFYVDGVKVKDLSVLPGYLNGNNYGVFEYSFDAEKTYHIEIRGSNTVSMDAVVKRKITP